MKGALLITFVFRVHMTMVISNIVIYHEAIALKTRGGVAIFGKILGSSLWAGMHFQTVVP